jgi:cephalosporin hydroxylase
MSARKAIQFIRNELDTLRNLARYGQYINPMLGKDNVDWFHRNYYNAGTRGKTWSDTFWLGVQALKCPFDLWVYQETIWELKPDVIIETGTANGGGALFLASICDMLGNGVIVTIDIEDRKDRPKHNRIEYLTGSSTSREITNKLRKLVADKKKVMVLLDSDHHRDHVLSELRIYSRFVTKGSYIIVEDTNINGHPVAPDFGPGPMEAIEEFLKSDKEFVIDKTKEKFHLTFNPNGYLKKVR